MSTIKQILRMRMNGMGKKPISEALGISKNTVKKYLEIIDQGGWDLSELIKKDEAELDAIVFSNRQIEDTKRLEDLRLLIPGYHKRLLKVGVTRQQLWNEYKILHSDGYQYSNFCSILKLHSDKEKSSMHIEHSPGDKLFIDFTGKKLSYVDASTGEIIPCEVLVMVLGFSQLTYVEATPSQNSVDFTGGVCNGFEYFGGLTRALVPDNLKAAVNKACNYEPEINATFLELANHYQTSVYPARSYKPKDKALVERYVAIVYNRIFAALGDRTFFSIEELNEAIWIELEKHNQMNFQSKPFSRRMLFEQEEKATLIALPEERFEVRKYRNVKVMKNGYVCLSEDKNYYSVPYQYIGEQVKISYTTRMVTVHHKLIQIAVHIRNLRPFFYTTIKDHLSSQNRFVSDWNPEKFINWGRKIHPDVEAYITSVLSLKIYPEQLYRSCVGILKMEDKVGRTRLIAACQKGNLFQSYGYHFIKNILNNKLESLEEETDSRELPLHENIRGKDQYK